MNSNRKITLEIPEDVYLEIDQSKKRANVSDEKLFIINLIKYALAFPYYFNNFDWNQAGQKADQEVEAGQVKTFSTKEELLSDLNS